MTVLITGGARSLGARIAELFASKGFDVIINYNNSYVDANNLKNKLEKEYNEFIQEIIKLDPLSIINKTYEITLKQEIKDLYIDSDILDRYEIKALLERNNTLKYLYESWLEYDFDIHKEVEELVQEDINELCREYVDKHLLSCKDDNKYIVISDTLEELNYYDFCYHLKQKYGLGEYETFSPLLVKEILDSGGTRYLYDFFNEIKDNEQLKYLVDISNFNSNFYNNIEEKILPTLKETIAKEKKQKDKEER